MQIPPRFLLYGFCALCLSAAVPMQIILSSGHHVLEPHHACTLRFLQRFHSLEGLVLFLEALVIVPVHLVLRLVYPLPEAIRAAQEKANDQAGACVCPLRGQFLCLLSVPSSKCIESCAEHVSPDSWQSARLSSLLTSILWSPSLNNIIVLGISLVTVAITTWGIIWISSFIKRDMQWLLFGGSLQSPEDYSVRPRVTFFFLPKLQLLWCGRCSLSLSGIVQPPSQVI